MSNPEDAKMAAQVQANMQKAKDEDVALYTLRKERRKLEQSARCTACNGAEPGPENELLLCDNLLCQTIAWHQKCLPIPVCDVPDGNWYCPFCVHAGAANCVPVSDCYVEHKTLD